MKHSTKFSVAVVLLSFAASAAAHPGHAQEGVAAGLMHPLAGLDHWMAMIGLGLWSRAARVPLKMLAIVGAALLAGAFGQPGMPAMEPLLAASVLVAGLMGIASARLPAAAGLALAALFGVVHGQAHGQELLGASAAMGAIGASLGLIGAGWLAGNSRHLLRVAPALLAIGGGALLTMA